MKQNVDIIDFFRVEIQPNQHSSPWSATLSSYPLYTTPPKPSIHPHPSNSPDPSPTALSPPFHHPSKLCLTTPQPVPSFPNHQTLPLQDKKRKEKTRKARKSNEEGSALGCDRRHHFRSAFQTLSFPTMLDGA